MFVELSSQFLLLLPCLWRAVIAPPNTHCGCKEPDCQPIASAQSLQLTPNLFLSISRSFVTYCVTKKGRHQTRGSNFVNS